MSVHDDSLSFLTLSKRSVERPSEVRNEWEDLTAREASVRFRRDGLSQGISLEFLLSPSSNETGRARLKTNDGPASIDRLCGANHALKGRKGRGIKGGSVERPRGRLSPRKACGKKSTGVGKVDEEVASRRCEVSQPNA